MLSSTHLVEGKTWITSYSSAPSTGPVPVYGPYLWHQSSRRQREHPRHPRERPFIGIQCSTGKGAAVGWCQSGSQSGKPKTQVYRWAPWIPSCKISHHFVKWWHMWWWPGRNEFSDLVSDSGYHQMSLDIGDKPARCWLCSEWPNLFSVRKYSIYPHNLVIKYHWRCKNLCVFTPQNWHLRFNEYVTYPPRGHISVIPSEMQCNIIFNFMQSSVRIEFRSFWALHI